MKPRQLMYSAALTVFVTVPTVLATNEWYVDGVNGSNRNNCESRQTACKTIAHAIALSSPDDSIIVAAATYLENLSIPFGLKIIGSGRTTTIIDGSGVASEFIITNPNANVTLSRMTMRNGGGLGDGGGIYNCFPTLTIIDSIISGNSARRGGGGFGYGGGIYNCPSGSLTIINSTFSGNSAERGGAICNGGTLRIIDSTFSGNTAIDLEGGAIRNYGTLIITNSTFGGNSASVGSGGGIHNGELFGALGTLVMNNSTVSGNIAAEGKGGGIVNPKGATAILQNSIVANNRGSNCHGTFISNGYNLSSDETCGFTGMGDLSNTDPNLGPLQDNGGLTQTMALLPGSPAIDTGNPAGCTDEHGHLLKTDQRGMPRPDKEDSGVCDRGSYERQGDN